MPQCQNAIPAEIFDPSPNEPSEPTLVARSEAAIDGFISELLRAHPETQAYIQRSDQAPTAERNADGMRVTVIATGAQAASVTASLAGVGCRVTTLSACKEEEVDAALDAELVILDAEVWDRAVVAPSLLTRCRRGRRPFVTILQPSRFSLRTTWLEAGAFDVLIPPLRPSVLLSRAVSAVPARRVASPRRLVRMASHLMQDGLQAEARALELSHESVLLSTDFPVARGALVKVTLFPVEGLPATVLGKCLFTRAAVCSGDEDKHRHVVGLRLVGLTPDELEALDSLVSQAPVLTKTRVIERPMSPPEVAPIA